MEKGSGSADGRIALVLQYDGTGFNGWQVQNGGRTVQGEIEKAIQVLLKKRVRVIASGRTDSGVHALGQVVHFDAPCGANLQRICIGLNGILPRDVAVKNAYRVDAGFHSRFGAVLREYRYFIYNHPSRTPFMMHRAMWVHERLNCDYLKEVAKRLIGEMDFSSFCKKRDAKNINPVRSISSVNVRKKEDMVIFDIAGNAFLHHMVRIIVGTMIEMNRGNREPDLICEIIAKRDREWSGVTAPAYGLYLARVTYQPGLETMEAAF